MRPPRITVFLRESRKSSWGVRYRDHLKERRSVYFDKREQAEAYAAQKEKQIFEEGLKSLELSDQVRHEAFLAHAILGPLGKGILEAAQFLAAHLKETDKSGTVTELLGQYLFEMEVNQVSPRHLSTTRQQLNQFARDFGAQIIGKIPGTAIHDWLRKRGWNAVTQANYLRCLKTFFKFACKQGYAKTNPVADIKPPKAEAAEPEIYTPDEMKALLRAAAPHIIPFLVIGGFTGLRTNELRQLTWENVHLDEGHCHIEVKGKTAKTRQRRIVPVSDNLKAWLKPYVGRTGLVLQGMNESALYDGTKAAARQAGFKWRKNALRHSFASYREAQIHNVNQVSSEMGNSPSMVFKHYRALVKPRDAEAFWNIYPEPTALPDVVALAAAA